MKRLLRYSLIIVGTISVVAVIVIGTVIFILIQITGAGFKGEKFDKQVWSTSFERCKMSEDLINNHLIVNKPKQEVIELLGEPMPKNPYPSDGCIAYLLGSCGTWDPFYLQVCFDDKDKVKRVHTIGN